MSNQPSRLVMYLRKSSEAEDRQQLSIPAQERELRELAARQGLQVVAQPIAEAMSAKRPGRPGFAKLMDVFAKSEADGILVWALDRLARNPVDGGSLMWALGEGQIKSIVASDRTYTGTGDDKLLMSIMFGMATKYSDDLSRNVKRGNRQALLSGRWPSHPPIGYVRRHPDKAIIPDPERWDKVRELWAMRLAGTSVEAIFAHARDVLTLVTPPWGTRGRRPLSLSETYYLFTNPFYTGRMRFGVEEFQGEHLPMVSEREFQQVQALSRARTATTTEHILAFPYAKLLRCGRCGAAVTVERKTNRYGVRYTYYHCSRKQRAKGFCPERCVEYEALHGQVLAFVEELSLPTNVAERVVAECRYQVLESANAKMSAERVSHQQRRVADIDGVLQNLRRMRAEGEITAEDYAGDRQHYESERAVLVDDLRSAESGQLIEPFLEKVSWLTEAKSRFESADEPERRAFLKTVTSNLVLKDRKVVILAKEPLEQLRAFPKNTTTWAVSEIVRTILRHYAQAGRDHPGPPSG